MRWAGKIGYATLTEVKPGTWEDVITEVDALGELKQSTEPLDSADSILPRYRTTTSVSVLSDGKRIPDAGLRYITWQGTNWQINTVSRQWPRIVIYIGGEYHGPLPS